MLMCVKIILNTSSIVLNTRIAGAVALRVNPSETIVR